MGLSPRKVLAVLQAKILASLGGDHSAWTQLPPSAPAAQPGRWRSKSQLTDSSTHLSSSGGMTSREGPPHSTGTSTLPSTAMADLYLLY